MQLDYKKNKRVQIGNNSSNEFVINFSKYGESHGGQDNEIHFLNPRKFT